MQQIRYLNFNKVGDRWASIGDGPIDVKITFKTVKEQRKFINSHETIFRNMSYKYNVSLFKIIKMKKIKHFSIIANIEKITLREYNLEKLGI
jgi:hypothetical protein